MDSLAELVHCCRALDTDKVTERKKQTDKFRLLLGQASVQKALDENTDAKQLSREKTIFAWDNVLKVVVALVQLETSALKKAKGSNSSTAISNREKKKQDICGLVKLVVRATDKRGERLKCSILMNHILEALNDPFTCQAYGPDYSSLLLKNVLCVRRYATELGTKTWQELISIYIKLFRSPPTGFNRVIVARLIHTLVVGVSQQLDIRSRKLLSFFTEVFKNIRHEKVTAVVEHLVSAMTVVVKFTVYDGRKQVCRLGEEVFTSLLFLLNQRPTDSLKETVLEFLHLQLRVHHPHGARTEDTGAFAHDWPLWQSHLRKLYEAVYCDLRQMGGRNRFSSGFKEAVLKPAYLELITDLCHQLFIEESGHIEVTQASTYEGGPGAKKRRLESGWSSLRDALSSCHRSVQSIPWLQLLSRLMSKYPGSLPEEEVPLLLNLLIPVLTECKRSEVVSHSLLCIESLARAVSSKPGSSHVTRDATQPLWTKTWASALRLISLHQCARQCFSVMSALVLGRLLTPNKDMWNLFFSNISSPTPESLTFVIIYLSEYDVPDNYKPSVLGVSHSEHTGSYHLRKQLCDWLLVSHSDLSDQSTKEYLSAKSVLFGEALTALVLKDCRKAFKQIRSVVVERAKQITRDDSDFEDLYLSYTFNEPVTLTEGVTESNSAVARNPANIALLLEHIDRLTNTDMLSIVDNSDPTVVMCEWMVVRCAVSLRFLSRLHSYGVITEQDKLSSSILETARAMMKKLSSVLSDRIKKDGLCSVRPVLSALEDMMGACLGEESVENVLSHILQQANPTQLIDTLLAEATCAASTRRTSSRPDSSSSLSVRQRNLMDDDFDLEMSSNNNNTEDFGLESSPQDIDDTVDQSKVFCASLGSSEALSEHQLTRVQIVRILVRFCRTESSLPVQQQLGELLDDPHFDPTRAVDIHILREVLLGWILIKRMNGENLQKLVDALRPMAKCHRHDQDLCGLVLDLIAALVPDLCIQGQTTENDVRAECLNIILRMLSVFWKLQEKGPHKVRLAFTKCLENFLVACPEKGDLVLCGSSDGGGDEEDIKLWQGFLGSVSDNCLIVRRYTARALTCLFQTEANGCSSLLSPDEVFSKMYGYIQDSLDSEGKMTVDEQLDQTLNRTSSLLSAMTTVACHSPVCEKKAIFTCLQLIKEKNQSIQLVKKGVEQTGARLGFSSVRVYLSSHLPYLVSNWVLKYPVLEFPYELLDYATRTEFFQQHYKVVFPCLLMLGHVDTVKEICTELGSDWLKLLEGCIPETLVYILPLFAMCKGAESPNQSLKARFALASACYDLLLQSATQQVVEKCIVSNLDLIVVNILMSLYDSNADLDPSSKTRWQDPEPNPPFYKPAVISSTLDYLTQSFSGKNHSLVAVLSKTQDGIQNILLSLSLHFSEAHRSHEKYRVLMMYGMFVGMLTREFKLRLGGSWAFVLREVVCRTIHIFTQHSSDNPDVARSGWDRQYQPLIESLSLDILASLCEAALLHCPQELGKYLPWIVSHLVGRVNTESTVSNKVLSLLRCLCVDNAGPLSSSVASLNQFPDIPQLKDFRKIHKKLKYASGPFTLEQEMSHFLRASRHNTSAPESLCGGLDFLSQQLFERSQELDQLVRQSSADSKDSVLCDLVWELVHLCTSPHQRVQMAASRCLGEIGPANLGVASVAATRHSPSLEGALEEYAESPDNQKYCVIFHLLDACLIDQCVHVVQSASDVLKSVLSTNTGQRFCTDYKAKLQDKDFLFQYLHPFQQGKKSTSRARPPAQTPAHKKTDLDSDEVWCPAHLDHRRWVIGLVVHILRSGAVSDQILANLEPVCAVKKKVSEVVLPYLIHDILKNGSTEHRDKLSRQISRFFSLHCARIGLDKDSNSGPTSSYDSGKAGALICENKESVKVLLSVIQYLRHQDVSSNSKQTPFEKNLWLDIDYSTMAKAAYNCSAYFTSVLYTEIWAEINRLKSQSSRSGKRQSLSGRSTSQLSQSSGDSGEWSQGTQPLGISSSGVNTEELLLQTYLSIGNPDGIYGCGAGKTSDNKSRIKTYEHERHWDKAAVAYAVGMNQPGPTAHTPFLEAMKNCGSYSLVGRYVSWLPTESVTLDPQLEELQYESAWRLGDWNMDTPTSLDCCGTGYNKSLYCALKGFHENQTEDVILEACRVARSVSLKQMTEASWESTRPLYPVLSNLHSLNHIEHLVQASTSEADLTRLLEKWSAGLGQDVNEFEFLEPPLSVQSCLLGFLVERLDERSPVHMAFVSHLERLVTCTRAAGRYELASDILCKVRSLPGPGNLSWQIEEACLYWDRGEQTTGKHLLKAFIDKLTGLIKEENAEASRLYPLVLMKYGNWLADTRSDSPNVIMEKYLEKAVGWLESRGDSAGFSLDAYLSLARYADTQYTNIVHYMNSPKFESKRNLMKKAKEELEKYRNLEDKRDRYLRTLEKQSQIDDSELLVLEKDRKSFLLRALHSYVRCLRCGDRHDLRIFRVISFWFDNAAIPEVNEYIMDAVDGVKTQKFLPLMYQLAARMSTTPVHHPHFKPTLDKLIARTATDHPYQTLLIILALAHANKDSEILNQGHDSKRGRLKKSSSELDTPDEERVLAAKNMVEKLRSSKVGKVLADTEKLCVAYIELANWNVDKYKRETKAIQLPTALQITRIKDLHSVVSPTSVVPVDPACEYSDINHVVGFLPTFKLAGGVNLPKIITCISSDGTWSKQLVKGKDDLRQDAVMQQVFEMVNSLLLKDAQTRQRSLSIRTYKVVPLSQRSGLLEWCEGTQPLGEYLVGNLASGVQGAHARYRPHDLAAIDCRRKMSAVHADPSPEKKHKVYREVCSQFLPVFRHFFLEKYLEPAQWYQRRLAYTRSVATNSIVGYILGLGDRHVQNILIDCNTAELIHIDLGVAFEQGHILPTPETVPFRLTRDIVDGMGITGVEGVFRRCCEKTMAVMHQNQESLLTILQVLLYDPLYTWTISPLKAYSLQQDRPDRQQGDTSDLNTTGELISMEQGSGESSEKVNKLAERTLLRLHEKLQGIEEGVQLSVLGQVNHLIQEARDTENLCKLFPGWQPYI